MNNKNKYAVANCAKNMSCAKLDRLVWNRIWEYVSNPNNLEEAINARIAELQVKKGNSEEELQRLSETLSTLETERQSIIRLFRKKTITEEDMEIQLKEVELQKSAIRNQMDEAKLSLDGRIDNLSELCAIFTNQIRTGISAINEKPKSEKQRESQFKIKQKIIQALVTRINLFEDHSFQIITEINLSNMPMVLESVSTTDHNHLPKGFLFSENFLQNFRVVLYL